MPLLEGRVLSRRFHGVQALNGVSAGIVGRAGALYAHHTSSIALESFVPLVTISVVLALTAGGTGDNYGAVPRGPGHGDAPTATALGRAYPTAGAPGQSSTRTSCRGRGTPMRLARKRSTRAW